MDLASLLELLETLGISTLGVTNESTAMTRLASVAIAAEV